MERSYKGSFNISILYPVMLATFTLFQISVFKISRGSPSVPYLDEIWKKDYELPAGADGPSLNTPI
jgi:hypothetical protein